MNKTWTARLAAGGLALVRFLVCVLVFVSFLLTILSFSLRHVVAERELYRRAARDEALVQELLDFVRPDLENECLFYGLPLEIVDEALSYETADAFITQYVDAVYDAAFVDGKLEFAAVDAALFRAPIAARLTPEGVEDTVIDDLAAEFAAVTTASWQMGLSQQLLTPAYRVVSNVWVQRFLNGGGLFAGATALLLVVGILLDLRHLRRQVFDLLGTLTIAGMVLYVPLWLLHRYGIASRLALGDSPLRTYVIRLVDSFTAQLANTTMWILIVCAALTVLATVWLVWPKQEAATTAEDEVVPVAEDEATAPSDVPAVEEA